MNLRYSPRSEVLADIFLTMFERMFESLIGIFNAFILYYWLLCSVLYLSLLLGSILLLLLLIAPLPILVL